MEPITASLIIFGAIAVSKPLVKLIETVGEHIGLQNAARRIRDEADAKRYARVQAELTKTDVTDIRQRMLLGNEHRKLRHQENWETIVRNVPALLPQTVSEKPVDDDWTAQFFDQCKNVSDAQMQSIWSQILAGEVAEPGSYSLRTLQTVKTLRRDDASKFTAYCQFLWSGFDRDPLFFIAPTVRHSKWPPQLILQIDAAYEAHGISGLARVHLESLNLIKLSGTGGLGLSPQKGTVTLIYFDKVHRLRHNDPIRPFEVQADLLTDIGRELAPISGARPNVEFETLILKALPASTGFAVES